MCENSSMPDPPTCHSRRRFFVVALVLSLVGAVFCVAYRWYWTRAVSDPLAARLAAEEVKRVDRAKRRREMGYRPPCRPPARWIELEGVTNARDIGGYATVDGHMVCWNLVYRSGDLSRLTATGCDEFGKLGIRRVIDFRNRLGLSSSFGGDAECVFDMCEMSLLPIRGDVVETGRATYSQLLHGNAESFRQVFKLIGDPDNLPILYHCSAGKDRTGIVTVLLFSLLGVDRDTIMQEYELSIQAAGATRPNEIGALFDEIDAQGGIESFLVGLGVAFETQNAVRALLLE